MALFKIIWTIDALASLVVFYFFFIGVSDGSVSSRNIRLWTVILTALGIILLGSIWLNNHHYGAMALGLLLVLALPALFYFIYLLIVMFSTGRWN
jgi:hypothetical protein